MVINQFHSIGDILFIEPILRHYWKLNGDKPILPVRDHLMYLQNYIESARLVPMSQFVLDYESMETTNPDYLPLRFANQILRNKDKDDHSDYKNCMPDKYNLCGLNPDMWMNLDVKFNEGKGNALFNQLGLKDGEEYILVNEHSQAGRVEIKLNPNCRVLYMESIPGYSVIDWWYVILNAKENHHVSTCTFYLFQAIANKFNFKSKVFIYPRPDESGIKGVLKLNTGFKVKFRKINSQENENEKQENSSQ
jgi:hypothetical protein